MTCTESDLVQLYRETADKGDAWGSCMGWLFALADYMTFDAGEEVPQDWHYRPAMGGPALESYEYGELLELKPDGDTLQAFAAKLWRLRGILKAQGRDY